MVPTRELAVQVCADLAGAGSTRGVRVHALYGGRAYEPQVKALSEGIDVAVATPGRLLDLVNQGHLVLGRVRTLVLDEADEMLDLGFLPDVERIIKHLPAERQTMLFSATMPGAVISLARQYMNRPTHIRAADPHDEGVSVANIKQHVYRAHDLDKIEMLARILQAEGPRPDHGLRPHQARGGADHRGAAGPALRGRRGARRPGAGRPRAGAARVPQRQGGRAGGHRRGRARHRRRGRDPRGQLPVPGGREDLHCTASDAPAGPGAPASSVTLVDWEDMPRWGLINKALGLDYAEPVELYSTSPQLYADLDIPEGAKGALPKQDRVRAGLDAEELEDLGETGRRGRGPAKEEREPEPRRERTPRQRRRTRGSAAGGQQAGAPSDEQAAVMGAAPVSELFREPAAHGAGAAEATAEPKAGGRARRGRAPKAEAVAAAPAETVATRPRAGF